MVVLEGFGDDLAHGEIDEGVVVGHEVQNFIDRALSVRVFIVGLLVV